MFWYKYLFKRRWQFNCDTDLTQSASWFDSICLCNPLISSSTKCCLMAEHSIWVLLFFCISSTQFHCSCSHYTKLYHCILLYNYLCQFFFLHFLSAWLLPTHPKIGAQSFSLRWQFHAHYDFWYSMITANIVWNVFCSYCSLKYFLLFLQLARYCIKQVFVLHVLVQWFFE